MKVNDYVMTPRFCTVRISVMFESKREAIESGFEEPTFYENSEYGILGKSVDIYHMSFAGYKK